MAKRTCTTMEEMMQQSDFEFKKSELFCEHIERVLKRNRLSTVEEQILELKKHMVKSAREKSSKTWMNAYHVRPEVYEHFRDVEKMDVERRFCRCITPCKHMSRVYYKFYFLKAPKLHVNENEK